MTTEFELTVPAQAENVIVVRQAMAGLAEAAGMEAPRIADLKTVITEACNNVVVHAYKDEQGPMEVEATVTAEHLEVAVSDRGEGFQPSASEAAASLGLGLPLIASLSDAFGIHGGSGQGTRLTVRFALAAAEPNGERRSGVGEELRMEITPGLLVRPVLARVLGALAARAEFSVERLSDTVLLGDAVSDRRAGDFREGRVGVEIIDGDGTLDIRVGPLNRGGGERILADMDLPGDGGSLRALARTAEVEREGDTEYLVLEVAS
jgi:serine/threonine-protein kinase RsbW